MPCTRRAEKPFAGWSTARGYFQLPGATHIPRLPHLQVSFGELLTHQIPLLQIPDFLCLSPLDPELKGHVLSLATVLVLNNYNYSCVCVCIIVINT